MSSISEPLVPELPSDGDLVGQKYRIERCIGRGGMGVVYLARHEMLNHAVAIKLLLPSIASDTAAVTRFLNEARAAAQIRNEHVAKVIDVDTLPGGGAYMVMEYLEGMDLATVVAQQGAIPIIDAVDYILQALEAIAQAHALGIVHRDLKPANLFMARGHDGIATIKVLDFGISKASGPVSGLTATNTLLGSPTFMSPEQVRSSKNVDPRSDIWSIGVCLYQLVTGDLPFKGENLGEIFVAILEAAPTVPSLLREDIPAELDTAIIRCLARKVEDRFANVAQLAEALAPFASAAGKVQVDRISRVLTPTAVGINRASSMPAMKPIGLATPYPAPSTPGKGLPAGRSPTPFGARPNSSSGSSSQSGRGNSASGEGSADSQNWRRPDSVKRPSTWTQQDGGNRKEGEDLSDSRTRAFDFEKGEAVDGADSSEAADDVKYTDGSKRKLVLILVAAVVVALVGVGVVYKLTRPSVVVVDTKDSPDAGDLLDSGNAENAGNAGNSGNTGNSTDPANSGGAANNNPDEHAAGGEPADKQPDSGVVDQIATEEDKTAGASTREGDGRDDGSPSRPGHSTRRRPGGKPGGVSGSAGRQPNATANPNPNPNPNPAQGGENNNPADPNAKPPKPLFNRK